MTKDVRNLIVIEIPLLGSVEIVTPLLIFRFGDQGLLGL